MPFPNFNDEDDLPIGIYTVALQEVLDHLAKKPRERQILGERLKRIYALAKETKHLLRFVIFGSFVTDKEKPNDIDIFMIMDDEFDISLFSGEQKLLFNHSTAQDHFGASVFWVRKLAAFGGEDMAIEHWQIKRNGNRRGIIEVISEAS